MSHGDAYYAFKKRLQRLRHHPDVDHVRVMTACEWKTKKKGANVQSVLAQHPVVDKGFLSIRECFRGGIVDPACVWMDAEMIAQRLSHITNRQVPVQPAHFVDFNSQ